MKISQIEFDLFHRERIELVSSVLEERKGSNWAANWAEIVSSLQGVGQTENPVEEGVFFEKFGEDLKRGRGVLVISFFDRPQQISNSYLFDIRGRFVLFVSNTDINDKLLPVGDGNTKILLLPGYSKEWAEENQEILSLIDSINSLERGELGRIMRGESVNPLRLNPLFWAMVSGGNRPLYRFPMVAARMLSSTARPVLSLGDLSEKKREEVERKFARNLFFLITKEKKEEGRRRWHKEEGRGEVSAWNGLRVYLNRPYIWMADKGISRMLIQMGVRDAASLKEALHELMESADHLMEEFISSWDIEAALCSERSNAYELHENFFFEEAANFFDLRINWFDPENMLKIKRTSERLFPAIASRLEPNIGMNGRLEKEVIDVVDMVDFYEVISHFWEIWDIKQRSKK